MAEQKIHTRITGSLGKDLPVYSTAELQTAIQNAEFNPLDMCYVSDEQVICYMKMDRSLATYAWVYPDGVAPYLTVGFLFNLLTEVNNSGVKFEIQDTVYQQGVEVPKVTGEIPHYLVDMEELRAHSNSDLTAISNLMTTMNAALSDMRSQIYEIQAGISNKVLGNPINIEDSAQDVGYTVNNALGGQITFESPLVLLAGVGTLTINGNVVWTNVGLTVGLGVTGDTVEVQNGDVVTCSGMSSIFFRPYNAA